MQLCGGESLSLLEEVNSKCVLMVVPDEVSRILDNEQFEYVRHHDGVCDRWLIFCSISAISVELLASGEHLRIRTGPVVDLNKLSSQAKCDLYRRAMEANDQQLIGRFCGSEQIEYEIGLPFPGCSVLSSEQLIQALRTAIAVAYNPQLTTFL